MKAAGLIIALGILVTGADMTCSRTQMTPSIERNDYGKGKKVEELDVQIGNKKKKVRTSVEVSERQYSAKEVQELFSRIIRKMDRLILAGNETLDRVDEDLDLVTDIPGEPVKVSWELDRYDVMDIQGKLKEQNISEKGVLVKLNAGLERVSLSVSQLLRRFSDDRQKGSVTAEAAVAVPVFFLAVVTMLYLLEMMAVHTAVRSGLQYAGKKTAKESCVTQMLMPSRIENDLVYAVGEERLGRSIVRGGSSGIDCSRSKMSARTGIGKLTAEYQVVIPVPLFGIAPVKCSETMKIKAWSGYEREGWMDTGNDTVYVTETGLVYHKDYHCSHLDLSIRMTHLELVEGLRNENGGKYYPCEHCVKGNGGNIYITNSGDRYHSSLSCSGLKRTIYAIPISEAAGKGACSRCGQ